MNLSNPNLAAWAVILAASVANLRAQSDVRVLRTTPSGAGAVSTNTVSVAETVWRHVGVCAQPGGIQRAGGGGWSHAAGFLPAGNVSRPALDGDGDGVPDELDADNDGEGLADEEELDGRAFQGYARTDPNQPDTDGDGMDDARESAARFDPLDPGHRLAFTAIRRADGAVTLCWIGRGGGTLCRVLYTDNLLAGPPANVLESAPRYGGVPPWYKVAVTNEHAVSDSDELRFYSLDIPL